MMFIISGQIINLYITRNGETPFTGETAADTVGCHFVRIIVTAKSVT